MFLWLILLNSFESWWEGSRLGVNFLVFKWIMFGWNLVLLIWWIVGEFGWYIFVFIYEF